MDKAKKKRTTERMGFTKALKNFSDTQAALGINHTSTVVVFRMLEEKVNELTLVSDMVMDLLYDDNDATEAVIQKEYEETRVYREKFLTAKVKYESAMSAVASASTVSSENGQSVNNVPNMGQGRKTLKMPTIELIKFSGNIREWLPFWSQFKKIHEDTEIVKEDKFQYLMQAMAPDSRAAELVKSFPPTAENYDKVIPSLKNRFGRDDLQIEVYVRELLQLVLQNAITPGKNIVLSTLYDKIESHLRALESLGVTTDRYAAMLFPLVESSLPEELLRVWQRSSVHPVATSENNTDAESKNRLTQLIKFLEDEVQNELRISMAVQGFNLKPQFNNVDSGKNKSDKSRNNRDVPSATGLLTTNGRAKSCLFCNSSDHDSAQCEQAKKIEFSARQEIVRKKNACFNCLNIGHSYRKCRVNMKCAWCSRRHAILMCPNLNKRDSEPKETEVKTLCNLANGQSSEVLLQTLRVTLYNGEEKMNVRVVIDSGSQKSYITKEAVARIGYEPIAEQMLCHSLFGGKSSGTVKHKKYVVQIGSVVDNSFDQAWFMVQ